MKLAVLVACHASTRAVDHIGEVVRDLGKGSLLEKLRLHRTKCTRIVTKVVAPCLMDDLAADVGDGCFSIICDESTCNSLRKKFAFVVKYFSMKEKRMVLPFLGIVELTRQTAEALYTAFTDHIRARGLNLKKLIAIGTDGASSLCGCNHSLYTLLRERDCPKLQIVRCVCHSLNKCASYASKELPPSLEYMVRETRTWFSHSSLRKHEYAVLYKVKYKIMYVLYSIKNHAQRSARSRWRTRASGDPVEAGGRVRLRCSALPPPTHRSLPLTPACAALSVVLN